MEANNKGWKVNYHKGECQFYKHPIYLNSQNVNNQTSINIYKKLPSNQHNLIL
jgi:hypothetical protein